MTLALQTLGSNQTLDLGGLGVVLLALLGDSTADDELADIVLLVKTEEAADLGGTLGAQTLGDNGVGEAGELLLALLDDAQSKDGKVLTGDGCKMIRSIMGCSIFHAFSPDRGRDGSYHVPPRTDLRLRSPVRRGR